MLNHLNKSLSLGIGTLLCFIPLSLYAQDAQPTSQSGGLLPSSQHIDGKKLPLSPMTMRPIAGTSTGEGMRGGRIMASDTRPLPKMIQKNIDLREGTSVRMFGSSTTSTELQHGRMIGSSTGSRYGGAREQIGEHRAEIFKHSGEVILKRMHAAIDRFTKLAHRIDSRIKKIKSTGVDTSLAETALGSARTKITSALQAVTDAETAIGAVADSMSQGTSTPPSREEKQPAKDALEKARKAILSAGQSLNDIIPLLTGKQGEKQNYGQGTTTAASGTSALPKMMHTKDRLVPTTTIEHPNGTL